MSAFMQFAEINWQESSLAKLAKEIPNKSMNIAELDKPLSITKEDNSIDKKESSSDEKNIDNKKLIDSQDKSDDKATADDKDIDGSTGKKGGRFCEVFKDGEGDKYEVHHMPADSTTNLERNDGPAIKMDKKDHRETASCGNSIEAREYRAKQKELIENGKFNEALQTDIDDIHEKFGDKYDDAISEMLEYVKTQRGGKI